MQLCFIPLGIGDAFSARWYTTSFLIGAQGRWLLLDCPHPIRKMLCEASASAGVSVDVGDVDAVLLTHLHADHASGLEGLGYFARFALGRRVRLVTHPDVSARLWEGHLAAGMERLMTAEGPREPGLADYFDVRAITPDQPVQVGPFTIRCRETVHHVPTTAFRIDAGGRSVGFSADTAFDPGLLDWLSEADLVVHEANHGPAHTPYARLAELPAALRGRMRLVHTPDDFDREASVIESLEQGRLYEV